MNAIKVTVRLGQWPIIEKQDYFFPNIREAETFVNDLLSEVKAKNSTTGQVLARTSLADLADSSLAFTLKYRITDMTKKSEFGPYQ